MRISNGKGTVLFTAAVVMITAAVGFCTNYYVNGTTGSDGYDGLAPVWDGAHGPKKTIAAGISAAGLDDTVNVAAGVYSGTGNVNLSFGGSAGYRMTLKASPGGLVVIDAGGTERAFEFVYEPAGAVVDGFVIRNGYADDYANGNYLGGGGMYIHVSDVIVRNCRFENNTAIGRGGALSVWVSQATFENCLFKDNTAGDGVTASAGGAVCVISSQGTESTVFAECDFAGNFAYTNGGAVSVESNARAVFENCLFEGNKANSSGGAFYQSNCTNEVVNCTFYANRAQVNGGSFFLSGNTTLPCELTVRNSIFFANSAASAGNEFRCVSPYVTFSYSYNCIDPAGVSFYQGTVNQGPGNMYADPLFAQQGYRDAGKWVQGHYQLKSVIGRRDYSSLNWVQDAVHSTCIDAGDPADDYSLEPVSNGGRINMGRYANTSWASKGPACSAALAADITGDCKVNFLDFAAMAAQWLDCNLTPVEFCD